MTFRDRCIILRVLLACLAALWIPSLALLAEVQSDKWSVPLQPRLLVWGYVLGAVAGLLLGTVVFRLALRQRNSLYHSVAAIVLASPVAGVIGAIISFRGLGSAWPPEHVYGFDADKLICYGFVGGATLAAACIGVLSALRRSAERVGDC